MAAQTVSGIYEIVNLVNGKRYIGSAKDIRVRWLRHRYALDRAIHHSPVLQRAWIKYGADSFEFRLICECSVDGLIDLEQRYLDTGPVHYNVAKVAGYRTFSGLRHSVETLAKMSKAHRGNTRTKGKKRDRAAVEATVLAHRGAKRSDETRARISAAMTGKKRAPYSLETRAKLSAAMKARPPNPDRIAKMAATKKGSKLSDAHKKAIGEASKLAWAKRKALAVG